MVKVVKYYLQNGDIPSYIVTERNGQKCSGVYPNLDGALLGLGDVDGSEPNVTVFNTQTELVTYMETYMQDAKTPVFNYSEATTSWVPFDIDAGASWLWSLI